MQKLERRGIYCFRLADEESCKDSNVVEKYATAISVAPARVFRVRSRALFNDDDDGSGGRHLRHSS